MVKRKGQIQNLETIFVMIVIIIVIVIFTVSLFRIEGHKIKSQERRFLNLNMMETLQFVSYAPYFSCDVSFLTNVACIDYYKAKAFESLIEENDVLLNELYLVLGNAKLYLEVTYPEKEGGEKEIIELYKVENSESYDVKIAYLPVNIYNSVNNTIGFGNLVIEVYN